MEGQPPEDETRRRFAEILAAKKKANKAGNAPDGHAEKRQGRLESAKGGRGFKRRKV